MLPRNIQYLLNLFSYCTFQVFRNYTADLSPFFSLANHLIQTQSNPIILADLEDSSITHRYFLTDKHYNKSKSVWALLKFQIHSSRIPCRILLTDFDSISKDIWINTEENGETDRKLWIISKLLRGLAGFRETPNFIIFQDSSFSEHLSQVLFLKLKSHYAVSSPYIWLSNSETFFFCKTCPSQFMSLSTEQLRSQKELELYWKEIHKNLHLAPVIHDAKSGASKTECVSNGGTTQCITFAYSLPSASGSIIALSTPGMGFHLQTNPLVM